MKKVSKHQLQTINNIVRALLASPEYQALEELGMCIEKMTLIGASSDPGTRCISVDMQMTDAEVHAYTLHPKWELELDRAPEEYIPPSNWWLSQEQAVRPATPEEIAACERAREQQEKIRAEQKAEMERVYSEWLKSGGISKLFDDPASIVEVAGIGY